MRDMGHDMEVRKTNGHAIIYALRLLIVDYAVINTDSKFSHSRRGSRTTMTTTASAKCRSSTRLPVAAALGLLLSLRHFHHAPQQAFACLPCLRFGESKS